MESDCDKGLLSLAGEYRLCSELCRRGILATISYGNRKCADVYAICDDKKRAIRIEVKTTRKKRFITQITQKGLFKSPVAPDFRVLFQIEGDHFFIFSHEQLCDVQRKRNDLYSARYRERHSGAEWDGSKGVDGVRVAELGAFENRWDVILDAMKLPNGWAVEKNEGRLFDSLHRRQDLYGRGALVRGTTPW